MIDAVAQLGIPLLLLLTGMKTDLSAVRRLRKDVGHHDTLHFGSRCQQPVGHGLVSRHDFVGFLGKNQSLQQSYVRWAFFVGPLVR
jgi:hypothetical protein